MSRRRPRTLARALLVALLSVAIAVLGLGSMPAAQAAPKAQISGTVTDAEGAGIKGIVVTALEYDGDGGWAFVADTTTKKDGTYTIKNLPPATYTVEFRDEDGTYVDEYYDDQRTIEDATDVPVAAGQAVPNIDAELELTGFVSGTVTDEQGEPDLPASSSTSTPSTRTASPRARGTAAPPTTSAGTASRSWPRATTSSGSPTSAAPTSTSTTTTS